MKAKLFILTICFAVLGMGASAEIKDGKAMTGSSLTDFGRYTLVNSNTPMVVNNQVLKTFELTYENTTNPIIIGVVNEKDCKTFIVRSDEFEVEYTCTKGVFGVKKMEKKYASLPKEGVDAKMNKVSYYSQRVICQNKKSEDELLGLIACYFPNMINDEYHAGF